jgi:hypothetical protein
VIILVLGQREDCLSYLDYAAEHGHTVRFLDPPKLPGGDRAQWQRAVADAARASVELVDVDDVVCFHDSFQIQLELLRSELGLPSRDVDALLCLADKTRFKAHRTVREHITRHGSTGDESGGCPRHGAGDVAVPDGGETVERVLQRRGDPGG